MEWTIWVSRTRSRSGRRGCCKSNWRSRRRKRRHCSKKRERKMRRCCLSKVTIRVCSRRSTVWGRSWRNYEANTKPRSLKLEISLKSINNRKMNCLISFERRRRQWNLVTRSWASCLVSMSFTSFIRSLNGKMNVVIGIFLCLLLILRPRT